MDEHGSWYDEHSSWYDDHRAWYDDHRAWYDDHRAEVALEHLSRMVCAAEAAEIDLPHIVVCRDGGTGAVSYAGPFADGLAALAFAEAETVADVGPDGGEPLEFSVAALYPAGR